MKRATFLLTLVFCAALSSVFVAASAQDPQEAPAPAAPADEAPADEAPADEAPADEAPTDAAPSDEAPADEAAPADEPEPAPADEPEPAPADESADEPMDEPTDEPMDEPEGEPTDEAPADEGEVDSAPADEPEPAPEPKVKALKALSSLAVESGEAQLERKAAMAGAEPQRAKLASGTKVGLTQLDTALLGAESSGTARFGGCEVTLSENTTFKVLEVGAEMSVVEILGMELELERGTILEAAFGSLSITVRNGNVQARNTSGVPQIVQFNFNGARYTVTVPATPPGSPPPAISVNSNGSISYSGAGGAASLPMTVQPLNAAGQPAGPPQQTNLAQGAPVNAGDGLTLIVPPGGPSFADALQQGLQNAQDAPPPGTTPGTVGNASGGINGQ